MHKPGYMPDFSTPLASGERVGRRVGGGDVEGGGQIIMQERFHSFCTLKPYFFSPLIWGNLANFLVKLLEI